MPKTIDKPLKINGPVVVLPQDEYEQLLREAGYIETPKLDKEIVAARKRFKKGKGIKWEALKRELLKT